MIDYQLEAAETAEKAYTLEQECVQREELIDRLRERIQHLETELAELKRCDTIETQCEQSRSLFTQPKKGRKARFCSHACRQANYRDMKLFK